MQWRNQDLVLGWGHLGKKLIFLKLSLRLGLGLGLGLGLYLGLGGGGIFYGLISKKYFFLILRKMFIFL